MDAPVKITKLGQEDPKVQPKPTGSSRKKTLKTFPRGILKVKGVSDPAKSPPIRKTARQHTISILTEKGAKRHRKTIHKKVKSLSNEKVKQLVEKHGLLKNKNTPVSIQRDMLEGGAIAGFISLD